MISDSKIYFSSSKSHFNESRSYKLQLKRTTYLIFDTKKGLPNGKPLVARGRFELPTSGL